jgi:hypothetical protein
MGLYFTIDLISFNFGKKFQITNASIAIDEILDVPVTVVIEIFYLIHSQYKYPSFLLSYKLQFICLRGIMLCV